jgi:hypothetical protein
MNDSFLKDIVYDLIESKLKIKDLEDKLTILTKSNDELTKTNNELKDEANKWKTQITSYINDYRNVYNKVIENDDLDLNNQEVSEIKTEVLKDNIVEQTNELEENKKTRGEYMKEYMRNKRKKEKEELKNIIINKK